MTEEKKAEKLKIKKTHLTKKMSQSLDQTYFSLPQGTKAAAHAGIHTDICRARQMCLPRSSSDWMVGPIHAQNQSSPLSVNDCHREFQHLCHLLSSLVGQKQQLLCEVPLLKPVLLSTKRS